MRESGQNIAKKAKETKAPVKMAEEIKESDRSRRLRLRHERIQAMIREETFDET